MSENTTTTAQPGNFKPAADYADSLAYQTKFIRDIILANAQRTSVAARANHVGLLPEIADLLDQAADLVSKAGRKAQEAKVAFTERAAWQDNPNVRHSLTEEMNASLAAEAQGPRCDMTANCERPVAMVDRKGYVYCAEHGVQRRSVMPCRKMRPAELRRGMVEKY